jgi:putative endonuclease
MYIVYILKSLKIDRYYTGCSKDLAKRLILHNEGKVRSTRAYCPWKVIYSEAYIIKDDAFKREKEIKSFKSGEAFKKLLDK